MDGGQRKYEGTIIVEYIQPFVLVGTHTWIYPPVVFAPRRPLEQRVEFYLTGSRQFSDCHNKTLEAETTAATNRRTQGQLEFSSQGLRTTASTRRRHAMPRCGKEKRRRVAAWSSANETSYNRIMVKSI